MKTTRKMNKKIYVIAFLLMTIGAYSQQRINVTLKNGDKITGKGKVTLNGVSLKTTAGSRKIEGIEIERVVVTKKNKVTKFAFRPLKKGKKPKKLQILHSGKGIELFEIAAGKTKGSNVSIEIVRHYIYRDGEEFATMIASGTPIGKNFKKRAKEYFSDCQVLVDKIGTKGFKKNDLKKIIKFYEKNCGA